MLKHGGQFALDLAYEDPMDLLRRVKRQTDQLKASPEHLVLYRES